MAERSVVKSRLLGVKSMPTFEHDNPAFDADSEASASPFSGPSITVKKSGWEESSPEETTSPTTSASTTNSSVFAAFYVSPDAGQSVQRDAARYKKKRSIETAPTSAFSRVEGKRKGNPHKSSPIPFIVTEPVSGNWLTEDPVDDKTKDDSNVDKLKLKIPGPTDTPDIGRKSPTFRRVKSCSAIVPDGELLSPEVNQDSKQKRSRMRSVSPTPKKIDWTIDLESDTKGKSVAVVLPWNRKDGKEKRMKKSASQPNMSSGWREDSDDEDEPKRSGKLTKKSVENEKVKDNQSEESSKTRDRKLSEPVDQSKVFVTKERPDSAWRLEVRQTEGISLTDDDVTVRDHVLANGTPNGTISKAKKEEEIEMKVVISKTRNDGIIPKSTMELEGPNAREMVPKGRVLTWTTKVTDEENDNATNEDSLYGRHPIKQVDDSEGHKIELTYKSNFEFKFGMAFGECEIGGIAFLKNGMIVLHNRVKNQIRVFSRDFKCLTSCDVAPSRSMSAHSDKKVAFASGKEIIFCKVKSYKSKQIKDKHISIRSNVNACARIKETYFVVCDSSGHGVLFILAKVKDKVKDKVKTAVLNKWKVVHIIKSFQMEEMSPIVSLCGDEENKRVFISDAKYRKILAVTSTGDVLFSVNLDWLPRGITLALGFLVVCNDTDHSILLLNTKGEFLKTLVRDLHYNPEGVAFDPSSRRLLVSSLRSASIRVYDLRGRQESRDTEC